MSNNLTANGQLLRSARLRHQMDVRDLAARAGVTAPVIRLIEKENRIGSRLTLAQVTSIADAAGISLTQLLTPANMPDDATPRMDSTESGDAMQLVQTLVLDGRRRSKHDLAAAHGWTLDRLQTAADLAEGELGRLGLLLMDYNGSPGVAPADSSAEKRVAELKHPRAARTGMKTPAARLLHQAITQGGVRTKVPDADMPHLRYLLNVGVLRAGSTGEPDYVCADAAVESIPTSRELPQPTGSLMR